MQRLPTSAHAEATARPLSTLSPRPLALALGPIHVGQRCQIDGGRGSKLEQEGLYLCSLATSSTCQ